MTKDVNAYGKQVMLDGEHMADAISEQAAATIASALRLQPAAAVTDEMVERAQQAYGAVTGETAWDDGLRAALEAVMESRWA